MDIADGGGGGGSASSPSLDQRVSRLEAKVDRLESKVDRLETILIRLEPKISELLLTSSKAVDLAEVKGRVSSLPTWWMLMVTVLSTWTVGAGIVFTLVKAGHP